MAYRYSCFLSYQRGNDLLDRFVRELFQALSNDLALITTLPVWFNTARLPAGQSWSVSVEALRTSVCMVPVLTPTYFSQERSYCSREYLAMEKIEIFRQDTTGRHDSRIIPVVLRGGERLPMAIRQRECYDFSDYLAFGPRQFRSRNFLHSVSQLARTIGKLCESYRDLDSPDVELEFPSDKEAQEWLQSLAVVGNPTLPKI